MQLTALRAASDAGRSTALDLGRECRKLWRSNHDRRSVDPGWCGGLSLAISRQIHDGGGAEDCSSAGARVVRRSRLRPSGPLRWKGRDRQESEEVADPVRIPGDLQQLGGAFSPDYATRW